MDIAGKAESHTGGQRLRYWLGVLRPLSWWVLLVLVMFGYRTHQRLAEQTHMDFSVVLDGQPLQFDASTTLDGQPVASGDRVPLGCHLFSVSHPKGDSYSTKLFIWYGEHHLGRINLNRSRGTLVVTANPLAGLITIQGPEFSLKLTNSWGLTTNVPTDRYTVEAQYGHWQQTKEVTVSSIGPWTCAFAPKLGTVELACNQSGVSFQVADRSGKLVEAGDLPATILQVPEGSYKLTAWHHRNKAEQTLTVKAGSTNSVEVPFLYGGVRLETDPPGARVVTAGGQDLGVTPLSLSELTAGRLRIEMQLAGYSPVAADLTITALQTNTFRTNLISLDYSRAIAAARQYLGTADYDRAFSAAAEALQAKPNDAEAIAVQKEASGKRHLRLAESLGKKGDFIGADKELEAVLQSLPESEEAKQLLSDFKKHETEQIERIRVERAQRGQKTFDAALASITNAALFESHELKTAMPVKEAWTAISEALKTPPGFRIIKSVSSDPETFEIEAVQELSTALGSSAGGRQCLIVGAQTGDRETQILFKVLEYKSEAVNKISIGALIGAPVEVRYVPIHPTRIPNLTDKLKAQVAEGVKIVTERIQKAIGAREEER